MKGFRNIISSCLGVLAFITGLGLIGNSIVVSINRKRFDWLDLVAGLVALAISLALFSSYKRASGKSWMDIISTLFDLLTTGF